MDSPQKQISVLGDLFFFSGKQNFFSIHKEYFLCKLQCQRIWNCKKKYSIPGSTKTKTPTLTQFICEYTNYSSFYLWTELSFTVELCSFNTAVQYFFSLSVSIHHVVSTVPPFLQNKYYLHTVSAHHCHS